MSHPHEPGRRRRRGGAPALVVVAAVVLLVAGVVVGLLLVRGDDEAPSAPASSTSAAETASSEASEPTESATTTEVAPAPTPDVGPGPDAVADRFLAAVVAVDCRRIERLSTTTYLEREGRCRDDLPPGALDGATYETQPAAVAGASATVMASVTGAAAQGSAPVFSFVLTLVNTDQGWRVNDLAPAS